MRSRLGGCAVALVLACSACGLDTGSDAAAPTSPAVTATPAAELASVRATLPPAPHSASALTIVLVHPGGADEAGLDAAAAALSERPDVRVVTVAPGPSTDASTMSGFPVTSAAETATDVVTLTLADPGIDADLVVVGINRGHGIGAMEPIAAIAVAHGVPALVVDVEHADQVDYAAAAMQLLEVLDLELDLLLGVPPAVHRLAVPSCRTGMLRGRTVTEAASGAPLHLRSDCTTAVRQVPTSEVDAFAAGWATLSRLPS